MNVSDVITFRNIELDDQDKLLKLRNTHSNLQFFKNPNPVSPENHAEWFASRFKNFKELQILAVLSDRLIGIAYLVPIDDRSSSISINIDLEYQSQGIGQELLTRMISRAESLDFNRIEALIHTSNSKSVSLFEKCGFIFEEKISELFNRYVKLTKQNTLTPFPKLS